ncbi:albusnodin/ikarugamycin family macrolactam cyclase [Nocardiopsis sp. NPDC049922]|uniref:albusnodin/ikarugamycin family macrolactam cyclase n=1 Tax=Nocardiopsis sp. NPDC049922 TaxID=3155157 RepID=UPI0033E2A55F
MFGGTTNPHPTRRPTGTRALSETPMMWVGEDTKPIVVATRTGHLVAIGVCGATRTQVRSAARQGVPDDIAWRWPGAYVVVHVEADGLEVWTDLGSVPVYVRGVSDREVMWSTSARALASLDTAPALDLGAVTAFIKGEPIAGSLFVDVQRLPAGHRVRLKRGGWSATPVWAPHPSPTPTAIRLRRALEAAVAVRVDGAEHPACDFSGGLDSTSLALLAARRLAPVGRTIIGTTLHPAGITTGGDMDYATAAGTAPGLDHAWIGLAESAAPYRDLSTLPPTDEPPVSAISVASFTAQMRWVADHGCEVHMTGDGGDALLVTRPSYIAEMLQHRRMFTAFTAASRFAQVRRLSLRQALTHARAARPRNTGLVLSSRTHHAALAALIDSARSARADVELAATLGVRLENPFFDAQVIDAYLSLPLEEMPEPARYKPLLIEGMRDVLPAALQRRVTKASTTADHYEGLRRSLAQVDALLDGYLAEVGLLDVPTMRANLRRIAAGAGSLGTVQPIVAFEAWWRAMARTPWEAGVQR